VKEMQRECEDLRVHGCRGQGVKGDGQDGVVVSLRKLGSEMKTEE